MFQPMNFVPATALVIATYNWPDALQCCLLSVALQTTLPNEVIIADDGSDQRTCDIIDKMRKYLPIHVVHVWQEDHGFRKTQILNKAVSKCTADYVIQIDGDVILHPSFIADHLSTAETGVFVRGSRARLTPARTIDILQHCNVHVAFYSRGVYNRLNAVRIPFFRMLGQRKEMKSRSVRGSNLAFWKKDFIQVNGYNNDLNGWGHEDEELAARFINNDICKKIVKLGAVQFHLHHQELPKPNEGLHRQVIDHTLASKIKNCIDGYEKLY